MAIITGLVGAIVGCFLAYLYSRLFPVPLPGIPYNIESTQLLLGDLKEIKTRCRITRETTEAMFAVARKLRSPIAQILSPFPRKIVLVRQCSSSIHCFGSHRESLCSRAAPERATKRKFSANIVV